MCLWQIQYIKEFPYDMINTTGMRQRLNFCGGFSFKEIFHVCSFLLSSYRERKVILWDITRNADTGENSLN